MPTEVDTKRLELLYTLSQQSQVEIAIIIFGLSLFGVGEWVGGVVVLVG